MAEKKMYFGTRERMTWVNCPAINTDLSKGRWSSNGQFLNGGAYVRNSVTGNKRYQFSWNMASSDEIREILDYADGLYGSDLVYFLDPFAVAKNLLPSWWASPRLQNEDAPPLTRGKRPSLVDTPANPHAYPTKSAVYTLTGSESFDSVYIPLPPGYELHFGAHGSSTGDAAVAVVPEGGVAEVVAMLDVTSIELTNTVLSGTTGVTITAQGTGQMTLTGLVARVLPEGSQPPTGRFVSGQGHSGCRFDMSSLTVSGYSSPQALDKQAASATLIEVGGWEGDL